MGVHSSLAGEYRGIVHCKSKIPPIYDFDIVDDYPAIGGVVQFSGTLFRHLSHRYGDRLISVRKSASELGLPDASRPYLHRERQQRLCRLDHGQ